MTTSNVKPSPCPNCGTLIDRATSPFGQVPQPGDATLCVNCEALLIFNHDLTLRALTPFDQLSAEHLRLIAIYRKALSEMRKKGLL